MKKRARKEVKARDTLNRGVLLKWLRGQRVMNRITDAERRVWLERLTIEEARQIFDDLNQLGDRWKEHGGDLEALERRSVEGKIEGRRIFQEIELNQNDRGR